MSALNSEQLQELFARADQADNLLVQLQKQFDAVQSATAKKPAPQGSAVSAASEVSGSKSIQPGKYIVFLSTRVGKMPFDVLAAYTLASKYAAKSRAFSVSLVDKAANAIPSLRTPSKLSISGNVNVTRALFRLANAEPSDVIESTLVDDWCQQCTDAELFDHKQHCPDFITKVNAYLQFRSFLVGHSITAADISVWSGLKTSHWWEKHSAAIPKTRSGALNAYRWFVTIDRSSVAKAAQTVIDKQQAADQALQKKLAAKAAGKGKGGGKQGGKGGKQGKGGGKKKAADTASWDIGIDKDVWMGRIVTRFPPEPSGYLHIGHAKAVLLNWEIAQRFKGKMIVRLDDTNPVKEKAEFEENILRDLKTLGVTPDMFSHTSDYFEYFIDKCTQAIKEGKAYVDPTPREEMKDERMNRVENEYRNATEADNLHRWYEMQKGSEEGCKCCVRMKMDMSSDNGTLRDPTIYRVNKEVPHHRTGSKFKVYPTYDFACPIVDSLEGVTHAFRSKEYNERNVQYKWMWQLTCEGHNKPDGAAFALPEVFQFSRQDFTRTELSKRKLKTWIDQGRVEGWDDPRMPTIQGSFRRGLQLEALRQFVGDQAMSQRNNKQEWDKLWTYNKNVLDPKVGRFFAVNSGTKVPFRLTNVAPNTAMKVQLHPKFKAVGVKTLHLNDVVYVEQFDAQNLINGGKPAESVILMNLGVVALEKVVRGEDGVSVMEIVGKYCPDDKNFKNKPKFTWVTASPDAVPVKLVELDYLVTSDGEVNTETWHETLALAEPGISLLSRGDILQFFKRGFFVVDKPYLGRPENPAVLIFIPDGKSKAMSALGAATNKVNISTR